MSDTKPLHEKPEKPSTLISGDGSEDSSSTFKVGNIRIKAIDIEQFPVSEDQLKSLANSGVLFNLFLSLFSIAVGFFLSTYFSYSTIEKLTEFQKGYFLTAGVFSAVIGILFLCLFAFSYLSNKSAIEKMVKKDKSVT